MALIITKKEMFYLADIVWYLKGYVASQPGDDKNDFGKVHIDILTKVIENVEVEGSE